MTKITKYFLNKASYIAIDENGKRINVKVDYWNGKFKLSKKNQELEDYARKLITKKHRVNFIYKIHQ